MHANGAIAVLFEDYSVSLGTLGAGAGERVAELRTGLPLSSLVPGSPKLDKAFELLLRRLAGHGLLEYRVERAESGEELAIIEPQVLGYWPQIPELAGGDMLVLSRFAYMRRRGNEMVLESPLAAALFRIRDPKLASLVAELSGPLRVKQIQQQDGFPGIEFLALLADCRILFKGDTRPEANPRLAEGDHDLALWDFHDLLFHTRSTEGRHANPIGGVYPHSGIIPPLPAVRPSWPGKQIDLCTFLEPSSQANPVAKLLRERHSTRDFDDRQPITLAELARFLDAAARIMPQSGGDRSSAGNGPEAVRPYPSAGASWELELYLAVNICEGLPQGFYHYDAATHALVPIDVPAIEVRTLLMGAATSMGVAKAPQILITIAARFGRISWKYSSVAYSLILKDVGVLSQTLYLMATGMGLGGCAIGLANIDQFAKMAGIAFHIEGPVGQFALGRGMTTRASDW
ncbi:MAG: SagB family peptide dehydrogenase [Rhodomicrobium sp.]